MTTTKFKTTIGFNETGPFIGGGERRIQFNEKGMNALNFAQVHSQTLADAFVNYCSMTLASGEIPSCFRQDLSPEEVLEIKEELPTFQQHFPQAFFDLMLVFEH